MKYAVALVSLFVSISIYAENLAFIGFPISASRSQLTCHDFSNPPDPNSDTVSVCLSSAFDLHYGVTEMLVGEIPEEHIVFVDFYHYAGLPSYSIYEPAFVMINKVKGRYVSLRIDYAIERDGKWFVCEEYSDTYQIGCDVEVSVEEAIAAQLEDI